jgi:hypothetical protein
MGKIMSNATSAPDNILGTRPTGEGRTGTAQLLRAGLGLLRKHGLRAWGLAVLTLAIHFWIMQLAFSPLLISQYLTQGFGSGFDWWWYAGPVVNIAAGAPFLAAYAYALLLLLQHRRAGATTLFSPFRSAALWASTMMAGSAPFLVEWLVPRLQWWIPWSELQPGLIGENSLLAKVLCLVPMPEWIIADLPKWIGVLLAVPLAWSAMNVLVLGTPGFRAIAQSVRLARHHWRLATLYFAAAILLPLTLWVLAPLWDIAATLNTGIARDLLSGLAILCSLLISSVNLLLESLVMVLIYREMLWREREAEGRARLDSPAAVP